MRHKTIRACAALLMAVGLSVGVGGITAGSANADQGYFVPCVSSNPANYFTGYSGASTDLHGASTWEGTSANIRVESGRICDDGTFGSNTLNTAWVMVTNQPRTQWAQVGFIRYVNGYTYHFSQYYSGSGSPVTHVYYNYGALNNGEVHHYFVQYSPGKGAIEMDIDVTNADNTWFNPVTAWPAKPWSIQYNGESISKGTDMPGYAPAPFLFTDMQAQAWDDLFYPSYPTLTGGTQPRFGLSPVTSRSFYGWTAY